MTDSSTLLHDGDYGLIEGYRNDHTVFGHYCRNGSWSSPLLSLIVRQLGDTGGTFIDVGANIGLVSIPVAQRTSATCVAIEAEPRNFALLERNVERQGLKERVITHHCAAVDSKGWVAMARAARNYGDHHVVASLDNAQLRVRAAPLDLLLAGERLLDPIVMKVDTQGCEDRVLAGAAALLPRLSALVVEYWPAGLQRAGGDRQRLHHILKAFPYATILDQQSDIVPELRSTEDLLAGLNGLLQDDDPGFFDLWMQPNRKHER